MRLPQLPRSLLWDHNAHYRGWLLRRMPAGCRRALDAGCGAGGFAGLLATRVGAVDAVDRSEAMIGRARAAAGGSSVRWQVGDVLDPALPLNIDGYDLVTAVASLHHMPLRPALARLAALVRPGGVLAVVGCYRGPPSATISWPPSQSRRTWWWARCSRRAAGRVNHTMRTCR